MGIVIVVLLLVGVSYYLIHGIGRLSPPLGNFVFKYSKLLGPLLIALWFYYLLHKESVSSAIFLLALGIVLTLMPNKKRFS
jgi:hypothetical protein